jgi:formylglycine-generating enzyme required for sulfatase activity
MEKIRIPAGPFLMGKDMEVVELPDFSIAKFPTTIEEYSRFVEATGHRTPKWPGGKFPAESARHPVVNVSWEDALAYLSWVAARLPSEAEWEKTARGSQGWLYPWGNEFIPDNCNSSESKSTGTRPVDAHPGGVSPHGVMDMAGNVWEWTSSLYEAGADWRVLKGGSWDYKGFKDARAAARVYFGPTFRSGAIGFRCAWDS